MNHLPGRNIVAIYRNQIVAVRALGLQVPIWVLGPDLEVSMPTPGRQGTMLCQLSNELAGTACSYCKRVTEGLVPRKYN